MNKPKRKVSPTPHSHAERVQPWATEHSTTIHKKEDREQETDRRGSDLAQAGAAGILSRFSTAPARKKAPGEPGGRQRQGGDGIAAEPENPKNSAIHRKEFSGAEGGDLNKRHS